MVQSLIGWEGQLSFVVIVTNASFVCILLPQGLITSARGTPSPHSYSMIILAPRQLTALTSEWICKLALHIASSVTGKGQVKRNRSWRGSISHVWAVHHVWKEFANHAGRRDTPCTRRSDLDGAVTHWIFVVETYNYTYTMSTHLLAICDTWNGQNPMYMGFVMHVNRK